MAVVNEVVTKFSFVGSLKPQENFNKNLTSSIKLLAGMATAIQGATALFVSWTTSVTESIDPMIQLSRETDVAVESMQELGFAASQNGSDLNAVMRSIRELTKRSGEFARTAGGPAADAFLQLGLNVRDANGNMKTADRIMLDLRGKLQQFNRSEQADILDKLGIDPSMIQLLNLSGDAIDSLRERARALGTITKEQADAAASLNDSNTVLKFGLQALQNQIAVGVAPTVQEMTEGFINFLTANKDLIRNGIEKLGSAILSLSKFVQRMTPVILSAAAAFGVWKVATVGLGAALGAVLSPVTLITGAIIAVGLAIDDLIVAFKGGNSVIREFILSWTGFDITPALQKGVDAVKGFTSNVMEEFRLLFDLIANFDFSQIWDRLLESFRNVFNQIIGAFSSIGDFVGGFFGGNDGAVTRGSQTNNSSVSVSQGNNINVYSSDPVAAGQYVSDFSTRQLRETRQYFTRGGQ